MPDYANITPEATYWFRTPGGKWYKATPKQASEILAMSKGSYGLLKKGKREYEVAVLSAMPKAYKSKSDVERGLGTVLWDWGLGAIPCERVEASINRLIEEATRSLSLSARQESAVVRNYRALKEGLCGYRHPKWVEIREIKQQLEGPFSVLEEGEENIYFTDGKGDRYYFKHEGSEAQRSAFYKAVGIPMIPVGGYPKCVPDLERESGSWIATSPTGQVVEFFDRADAEKVCAAGWRVETALQYLARIHREVKAKNPTSTTKKLKSKLLR